MTAVRRFLLVLVVGVLVLAAFGVAWSQRGSSDQPSAAARETSGAADPTTGSAPTSEPTSDPTSDPTSEPTSVPTSEAPTSEAPTTEPPSATPTTAPTTAPPTKAPAPEPELKPGPALLSPGDQGDEVKVLQARLRQIDWFNQDVTGTYGDVTRAAVEGFQAKREIPVTGEVDKRTMSRLVAMTTEPTADELANKVGGNVPGALDARCKTGRVLCVDKTSRTLRWVIDGQVELTVDVRFGSDELPTREGAFQVERKSRDHVSSIYNTPMPFAMFFSRGQAVHYSPDFAARGYAGASHGCVNVRDRDAIAGLFDQVKVGDKVIVYRS
ncbi:L,D-transpeptidase family protein [Nocardioides plantarum]|uniref:L,D-transpeptidase family protein n=1 Tax=Nocardioides plantarum TaxID=29299 RepID=A0ABV5K8W4_9ACTN|nr:L,D-transpeptidase family protein [Nocardioides plantarum]